MMFFNRKMRSSLPREITILISDAFQINSSSNLAPELTKYYNFDRCV